MYMEITVSMKMLLFFAREYEYRSKDVVLQIYRPGASCAILDSIPKTRFTCCKGTSTTAHQSDFWVGGTVVWGEIGFTKPVFTRVEKDLKQSHWNPQIRQYVGKVRSGSEVQNEVFAISRRWEISLLGWWTCGIPYHRRLWKPSSWMYLTQLISRQTKTSKGTRTVRI